MTLRNDFENDLTAFLQKYALIVNGGSAQNLAGGGAIGAAIAAQGIQTTQKPGGVAAKSGVSLQAPRFSPTFTETRPAENANFLDFSRSQVTATLDDYVVGGLPVYLMPYEGASARGVKLPAHGTDAFNVAYAMTTTLNGCTVEVSGTVDAPYASHTNVIDVDNNDAAQKWFAREQKINARLFKLQQRFTAAEVVAGGAAAAPTLNRAQFGFYDPSGAGAVPGAQHKNYNTAMQNSANQADGQIRKTRRREDTMFGHYRYYCVPTDDTITALRNRAMPPNAIVIGRRDHAGWKFYYQVYAEMAFNINRLLKIKGFKWGSGEFIMNNAGTKREKFHATVVLAYGQLWPVMTEMSCTFGLGT